jgi:CHAT domain-containing protein
LEEAQQAYRLAIENLRPIRNEVSVAYQVRNETFREGVGSLYFEMADLLLSRAKTASDPKVNESLIIDARNTLEDFKTAELQDYFQEDCVQPSQSLSQTLQTASPNTAILYPILLQDRMEIIVNFPSGLKQYTVSVPEKELTQQARQFRSVLQQSENLEHQKSSEKLYSWLIQPLEKDLQAEGIHTLVMVPDGALRSIPLSALYNGKEFLIEKYAIATTPGLTMTDPQPLNRDSIKVLSLGITQEVQGFPALPFVEKELETLAGMYEGTTLMNEDFVVQKMENQLKNEDYNVVHIASHGLVESNVKNTFVLAFDQKITMDRLAELVGMFRFRKAPLELLTLSACETAAGDDRAALGLAGVAVKAGARSALATLWFIDDAVASDLIGEFYKQLQNPALSKAQALQKAQVKILQDPQFHHPNFWSPFLLINNWL